MKRFHSRLFFGLSDKWNEGNHFLAVSQTFSTKLFARYGKQRNGGECAEGLVINQNFKFGYNYLKIKNMKRKLIQVYEVEPEEFKKEILAGVEKLLKEFSAQFTSKNPEIWMSIKDVGELLGISSRTINNWSKEGILKDYKIGNRVRFKRSDIEQTLLDSNRKGSDL